MGWDCGGNGVAIGPPRAQRAVGLTPASRRAMPGPVQRDEQVAAREVEWITF